MHLLQCRILSNFECLLSTLKDNANGADPIAAKIPFKFPVRSQWLIVSMVVNNVTQYG